MTRAGDRDGRMPILISIIIPVCNGSRYLDGLIANLAQQLTEETELVFVDDGSRDDSREKLLHLQQTATFPLRVHCQENRGVSAARNVGMQIASGRYLTFVDVDDVVAEDYIAVLSDFARQGEDLVVFDSQRIQEGQRLRRSGAQGPRPKSNSGMILEFLRRPTRFGVYNLLIRREILTEYAVSFPEGFRYYEDYDFLLQIFARAERVVRLERILYGYVLREGSAMAKFTAERINCLRLMKQREQWMARYAPGAAPAFRQWAVARLYWSVLWQAALAFASRREFLEFARITRADACLEKLRDYPDPVIRLSSTLFLVWKPAFYLAVRLTGRLKSRVCPVALGEILPELAEDIDFY